MLAVYTGAAINALTLLAANDDIPNTSTTLSRVTFNMKAGTTYHVQLGRWHGAEGKYRLWFSPAGAQSLDRATTASANSAMARALGPRLRPTPERLRHLRA